MNWWGNSIDKAYGFSSIATNAIKKAQKRIDKVLDIPTEEELFNNKGTPLNTDQLNYNVEITKEKINVEDTKTILNDQSSGFSDISLRSPEIQLSDKNELVFGSYEEPVLDGSRLGDWTTEDSLTASQFEKCCDKTEENKTLFDIEHQFDESNEYSRVSMHISMTNDDDNSVAEICSIGRSDQNTPVFVADYTNLEKENNPALECNRYSHLSISSDCTTSTVKRVCSDMESSNHTDDFTSINNDLVKSDSSLTNEDEGGTDEVTESNLPGSQKPFKKTTPEKLYKDSICHSISVNSACKDDIDSNTTTSSDIEPLSCATSTNGDSLLINNHPPSRYFMPDYMKHQRSASGSSMSICKLDNCDDSNDPDHYLSNQNFQKQIEELSKKLDIRESKMIQLSRENIDLRDTINNLTRQIEQMNERQETDTTDINALTREFTTRLSDAEKRYQLANKERDQLKKHVAELKNTESQQIERVIKEKEEQVASLLQEGEKLAQVQLKANNTIKKLRSNIKDNENDLNLLTQKNVKLESEIVHLKKVLDSHGENERKHIEGINQLTKAVEKLEKENSQLTNSKAVIQDRNRSLESALDRSSHELVKLRKQLIELDSEKISFENSNKSLIDQQASKIDIMAETQLKLQQSEKEISLLQKNIQTQAREFGYKEDEYNSRISYLQDRVAKMEQRQEELSEGASVATKPILRQLEAFQNNCSIHTANWERNEMNLNMRLIDLQQKLSISEETAQTYKEQLQSRDVLSNSLREEKNKLLNQYNQEYLSKQAVIDEKMILEQKLVDLSQSLESEKNKHIQEIQNLEFKLEDVQRKVEMEKQNSNNLLSKLKNMQLMLDSKQERRLSKSRNNSGTSTIIDLEPDDSVSAVSNRSLDNADNKGNGPFSVYGQMRQQGVAVMMEYLETSVKQKEGQISKLHRELDNMSRSRDSMIDEMTTMTQAIEKLENKLEVQQSLIDNVSGLNDRYNALLQMYGEKFEECQELKMDIAEMKEVYRSHIDMLSQCNEM